MTELNSFEIRNYFYFQFQNTHWKEEPPDELDLEVLEELAPEIVVKDRSDPENLPLVLIEVRVFEVDQMDWDEDKNWVVTAKIINQKHKSYIRNEMWKLDLRKYSFQNRQKSQSRTKFTTFFPMVRVQKKIERRVSSLQPCKNIIRLNYEIMTWKVDFNVSLSLVEKKRANKHSWIVKITSIPI